MQDVPKHAKRATTWRVRFVMSADGDVTNAQVSTQVLVRNALLDIFPTKIIATLIPVHQELTAIEANLNARDAEITVKIAIL